jgi:hypothetical protein
MTIGVLHERGCSNRAIARTLGVDEKAVRYRLERLRSGIREGSARADPEKALANALKIDMPEYCWVPVYLAGIYAELGRLRNARCALKSCAGSSQDSMPRH